MLMMSLESIPSEAEAPEIRLYLNDQELPMEEPVIFEEGRLFVPIRTIVQHMDAQIQWNEADRVVELSTAVGDQVIFSVDNQTMEFNGSTYVMDAGAYLERGRSYLPIRHAAEMMHMKVLWDEERNAAFFYDSPLYTIEQGDTVHAIAEAFSTSTELLMERNGLKDEFLQAGDTLKTVIPQVMTDKLPHPDLMLLAKIIHAEAGYEPFEGQVAVGNVILNRVEDPRFPDTIREVIYARGQFTPAMNGTLESIEPNESSVEAAEQVLNGENVAGDALYFINPNVSSHSFFSSLETVTTIGNHRFAK